MATNKAKKTLAALILVVTYLFIVMPFIGSFNNGTVYYDWFINGLILTLVFGSLWGVLAACVWACKTLWS